MTYDVIVIGSGPAGISAAVTLKQRGIDRVCLLEREAELGGIPRHCGHSPFGMREFWRVFSGPSYARRLAATASEHQVSIHARTTVTALKKNAEISIVNDLGRGTLSAKRIILATGTRERPRSDRLVSGDRPIGVLNTGALQSYVHLQRSIPFKRPVIVGTELVAMSAILTCLQAGIKPVAILEENGRPTARRLFALFPRLCGVPLRYNTKLEEIHGIQRVEGVRVRSTNGILSDIGCDGVIFCGQFLPEAALLARSHLGVDRSTGGPIVDQFGRCTDNTYFAAGNLLRPVETAGWCYREGLRIGNFAADDLDRRLPLPSVLTKTEFSHPITYVLPQRVALPLKEQTISFQLRVTRPVRGTLHLLADEQEIWSARFTSIPERRILVVITQPIPANTSVLRFTLREHGRIPEG